jgi:hypothetical protein
LGDIKQMLIRELMSYSDQISETQATAKSVQWDTEQMGAWQIRSTLDPITDKSIPKPQWAAIARHAKKDQILKAFSEQGQADAIQKVIELIHKLNPIKTGAIRSSSIYLNTAFVEEYYDKKSGSWFKIINDQGNPKLVMANPEWVSAVGTDIHELGFKLARARYKDDRNFHFVITPNQLIKIGLKPNARYKVVPEGVDSDGHEIFALQYVNDVTTVSDKVQLKYPSITVMAVRDA